MKVIWTTGKPISLRMMNGNVLLAKTLNGVLKYQRRTIPKEAISNLINRVNAQEFQGKKKNTVIFMACNAEGYSGGFNLELVFSAVFEIVKFDDGMKHFLTWNSINLSSDVWTYDKKYREDSDYVQIISGKPVAGFDLLFDLRAE